MNSQKRWAFIMVWAGLASFGWGPACSFPVPLRAERRTSSVEERCQKRIVGTTWATQGSVAPCSICRMLASETDSWRCSPAENFAASPRQYRT